MQMVIRFSLVFAALLGLASCSSPAATSTALPAETPAAAVTPNATPTKLVVMTHDSFDMSEEVLLAFEQQSGADVEILKGGDAGAMLNQAILTRDAPLADVIFGIDNTFMSRALNADLLLPYASPALSEIDEALKLDPSNRLLPVDYGYVTLNYDRAQLAEIGPLAKLEDLTLPEWKGKLVVLSPSTSSPGLAFLLSTIQHFGEDGDYTWKDFWAELRANEVRVSSGWSDAYYTLFSGSSGKGPYPLVVSYATSPAAEVYFSEGSLSEPPTGNLLLPGASFRQVEFVGILKGTKQESLAQQFVDFMLQSTFQSDIPLKMFVYPANKNASLPEVFVRFAEVPQQPVTLTPEEIEAGRERWIREWSEIVLDQ